MRKTREQWAALVATFGKTTQSTAEFCARRGVSPRTFAWWRWRLRHQVPARGDAMKLLAVDVVDASPSGVRTSVVIAVGGVEVRLDAGVGPEYVAAVVSRLRGA
jgi:hypothetical protein